MTGEVFNHKHFVKHDDLWHESDSLKPQREAPAESPGGPASVQDASQDESHRNEDPVRELVTQGVIGRAERHLKLHEVDGQAGGCDEEDLHEGVVHGDEVHEQVRVAHQEHKQVDLLSLC